MPVTAYSTTAAANNGAVPNGAPEGMAPSSVNDVMRQIMADIATEAQTGAVATLNTIAGTDTITADMNPELAAYVDGMVIKFTPANNNTGAATINIDGLGARSIVKGDGTALAAGDLQASTKHMCMYDGTNFVLLNPLSIAPTAAGILAALLTVDGAGSGLDADLLDGYGISTGSFTGTLTGMTVSTTGTVRYINTGRVCCLYISDGAIQGTSNSTAMTMSGLPAACQPSVTVTVTTDAITDNGNSGLAGSAEISSSTISFAVWITGGVANRVQSSPLGFTNSGTKGLGNTWCICYPI